MGITCQLFNISISTVIFLYMNIRKFIFILVSALLLLTSTYLGFKIWSKLRQKEKQKTKTQQLPSLPFHKIDGTILYTSSFAKSTELLVLNYFNPDCEHCQSMVKEMFREQALLKKTYWLMITTNTVEKTKQFADSMKLSLLPNVTVLSDTAYLFARTFGDVPVPSFYVYKDGVLLRKHSGECSIIYLLRN